MKLDLDRHFAAGGKTALGNESKLSGSPCSECQAEPAGFRSSTNSFLPSHPNGSLLGVYKVMFRKKSTCFILLLLLLGAGASSARPGG